MNKTQCPYCLIAEGKIQTNKVYEDENFLAALEIKPANAGHVILFPKKHFSTIQELPDDLRDKLLSLAGKIAKVLTTLSEGVNILLSSGQASGQMLDHLTVNLIPRFTEDKIFFNWSSRNIEESEMKQLSQAIYSALNVKEVKEIKKEPSADYEELNKQRPRRRV